MRVPKQTQSVDRTVGQQGPSEGAGSVRPSYSLCEAFPSTCGLGADI